MSEEINGNQEPVYSKPQYSAGGTALWILGAIIMLLLSGFLSFITNLENFSGNREAAIGFAVGNFLAPVILAAVVVALFMIGKKFRNLRSVAKIVFFTALVMILPSLTKIGKMGQARGSHYSLPGSYQDLS